MKCKTYKRKFNKIIIAAITTVFSVLALVLTIVSLVNKSNVRISDTSFDRTTSVYSSNQAHITDPNVSESTTTISMTDAYTALSSVGDKTITISSANELYLFSLACNSNNGYLSKSYKLKSNIYYNTNNQFIPVGYNGTPFSGTFDGDGFEISNLKMVDITSQLNNASTYSNMYYYAMFAENTGTIKNLGVVESRNTVVSVDLSNVTQHGGVANLVGKNTGTVTYCYYRDLRDMVEDEIGLAFYGSYRIAGLVYSNTGSGKLNNCYIAVESVANHKITGYEAIADIVYEDSNYDTSDSDNNNLYYYDGSIESYNLVGSSVEITYKSEVFYDATFAENQNVGVFCRDYKSDTASSLKYYYTSNNNWYLPSKYNDSTLASYIKNQTPILRGLEYTKSEGVYTFKIEDVKDYLYMHELMNASDFFAGDKVVYSIEGDIDLEGIAPREYVYNQIITAKITGKESTGTVKPTLITGVDSSYPTIFNFDAVASERKTATLGIEAYGLFPYLGGEVSNLNVVPYSVNLDSVDSSNNVKAIAAVSGYVEKGTISNVNVYITTTHSASINEFYLGGVAGILGGEGTISDCTVAGSYLMTQYSAGSLPSSVYTQGFAIGGVVGYIADTYGSINTCLSAVNMNLNFNAANVDCQVGGVVGAAYTINADELENIGTISVGANGLSAVYKSLYVAGVIGRHLGVKNQVMNFTNQGDVTVYGSNSSAKLYLAGIINADILTTQLSTGLIPSSDKTKDGRYRYRASSLANRANIKTLSQEVSDTVEYTSGVNLITETGFVSELSGVYNLNYTEKYNNSATKTSTALSPLSLDMQTAHTYSGVVNVINGSTPNANMTTDLMTVYNLRDLTITPEAAIGGKINYSYYGTVRGKYINYDDVRNEGKITATINKNLGSGNNTVNIVIVGVLEEVSVGCKANEIVNGGDIDVNYTSAIITGNVIVSGICYKNSGYDASTIDTFNPSSVDFDSKAEGSLNNVINNGSITIDNTSFSSVSINYDATVMSANGQSYLGTEPATSYSNNYRVTGDIFASGIAYVNEAPITNTFNLGDIFASNYINDTSVEREINIAGIVDLNIGKYAYILNSANNGTLKGINLSSGNTYLSNVNVSGIIARNDELEDGSVYGGNTTNPNSAQIVSFAINYGDIYSYNFALNTTSTAAEAKAKSAGIVAMGLLNTINVVNYGNIYGSETASGIFGVMYFSRFASEVTENTKVYIANTINYGNVYMLSRGYNHAHGNTYLDYNAINYTTFKGLTTSSVIFTNATAGNIQAFTSIVRNTDYISTIGSIFAIANYATSENSANIAIRYLISFNKECGIVGETVGAPVGVSVSTDTLYSAHVSTHAGTGAYLNDKWINNYVQYAPLSTGSVTGSFVTSINANTGLVTTGTRTYYGIFNNSFPFRQAVLGKVRFDTTTNPTDAYLTDYFEFVGFKYINPVLFEKIGWQTMAYSTAATDFATNVGNVVKLLNKTTNYTNYKTSAKDVFTWMQNSAPADLEALIDALIADEDHSALLQVLQYIFSADSQSNIYINIGLRESILNKLVDSDEELITLLSSILKYENGFSQVLAESIMVNEDAVKTYIDTYLDTMQEADIISLMNDYISYLEVNSNSYFNYGTSEAKRIELLTTLLANINDARFYRELVSILDIDDTSLSATAKMLRGYQSIVTDADKKTLFETIISYNFDNIETYLDNMSSDINFYSELVKDGYNITSMSSLYSSADITSGSSSTSSSIIDERVALWNLIKDTSIFRNKFTSFSIPNTLYFNATEYNNTYQSITEPHNDGAYLGNTSERLSYMYTTDITPAVYFYGPYTRVTNTARTSADIRFVAADGTQSITNPTVYTDTKSLNGHQNNYYSLFHYSDDSLWTSTATIKGRGGNNSTVTYAQAFNVTGNTNYTTYPFPMLIYYDSNNEQLGGANSTYTTNADFYVSGDYPIGTGFRGFSNQQFGAKNFKDPMTGISRSATDWSGTLFGTNDLYLYVQNTGEYFSLSNATMGPRFTSGGDANITLADGRTIKTRSTRCYIQDKDGAYHPVQGSTNQQIIIGRYNENNQFVSIHTLQNFDGQSQQIYSFIASVVGLRMYTSTVSTAYHSTARTGIYRRSGGWNNYFTWKQNEKVHVYTSQIIDYSHSDLLNLDGYLTQYADGKTQSADEREIINYIFNTYFLTSANIATFKKVVQAAMLEALGDHDTNGAAYVDAFFMANIYSASKAGFGKIPFAYLYKESGTTVQTYLNSLASFTGDNKSLLIYGAAGNQAKYVGLLKRLSTIYGMTSDNSYADLGAFLDYLTLHPGYINSSDKVVLSNLSSLDLATLEQYLSLFDDNSDINISNMYDLAGELSAYTGSVTYNQATYNSTSYDYGLKFTSMTLTPASTDTRIMLIAKSTGSSSTLTIGSDTVTVNGIGEYNIVTNGATSVTITSDSDVVVYAVYYIQDSSYTNQSTTLNGTVLTDGAGATYFTVSKSQIESQINTAIVNAIGANKFYNVTSYSVVANVSVENTNANPVMMYFADSNAPDTVYSNSGFNCTGNATTNTTLTMQDPYYDVNNYVVYYRGTDDGNGHTYSSLYLWSNARNITNVSYTITYSYIANGTVGTTVDSVSNTASGSSAAMTLPTLANVQTLVASDAGYASFNSNLTVTSATISLTVTNPTNSTQYYVLYNVTDNNYIVSNYSTVNAGASTTFANIDLTQYYGKQVAIQYYSGGWTNAPDSSAVISSYTYTVNYTKPACAVSPANIKKDRLLNLGDITYTDVRNDYLCYIYKNSTNNSTLHNNFIKSNLTMFAPINTSGNDSSPTSPFVNQLSNSEKIDFAKVVLKNSNAALYYLISVKCDTNEKLGEVLKLMSNATGGYSFIADGITKLVNTNYSGTSTDLIDYYSNVLKTLIATYVVADYRTIYNQNGNVYNTVYRALVDNANTNATGSSTSGTSFKNNIQYINSDGTFTATKYDLFVEYVLGQGITTSGYGIFALASSRGIQNGAFIPDNVDLTKMDVKYDTTETIGSAEVIVLVDDPDSSWRDNTGASTQSTYDTSDTTSINYHVRVEMKQLVKAISNIIFELDLECDDTTLYSSQEQMDYENYIITYYVSEAYLNYIKGASSLEILNLLYADTATSNKAKGDTISLTKSYSYSEVTIDSTTFDSTKHYVYSAGTYTLASNYVEGTKYYELSQIDATNAITIIPEETAYTANYTLRFIKIDNSVTTFAYNEMRYLTSENATTYATATNVRAIPYYGATIKFKVTASNLPDGMDLKSFFTITGQTKNSTWEFDLNTSNNGIVSSGVAYIVVNVDISMSQGTKAFVLNLYGSRKTVNLTKEANSNNLITKFGYDGTDYTSTLQGGSDAESTILYGRAFNYSDLTEPYIKTTDAALVDGKTYYVQNGSNGSYSYSKVLSPVVDDIATYYVPNPDFYLYAFEISSNATVKITATKEIVEYDLMKYTVEYLVTSESGVSETYKHVLQENSYFENGQAYGSLYKDGDTVDSTGIHTVDFIYNDATVAGNLSSLTYSESAADNYVAVKFNRGSEPQYRIRYDLSNFYGDITKYTISQGAYNVAETEPQDTYAGITITLDDEIEPGTYMYIFTYTNTGEWTAEGTYVAVASDATFDENETYYFLTNGEYVVRAVTAATFERLKSRLYTYQMGTGSTYTRTYNFPALYIIKDFATDALFHKLTFLDESVVLGGTATVMLPTTPISAGAANTDSDAILYSTVFSQVNDIVINPNSIEYSDSAQAPSVTDYYTVGTVSDTDLEYYAPTIKVEDNAQVFKYTTLTKLQTYGDKDENPQTAKDSEILSTRDDMLLYIPFATGSGNNISYEVFLVLVDSNMNWKKVYPRLFNGDTTNASSLIHTYTSTFNTLAAEKNPSLTTFSYDLENDGTAETYTIASFAGSTDISDENNKNISLYMDYIGTPLQDHFWYISYVVFSEYYLSKGMTDKNNDGVDDLGAVRYYHISIVDASNTVYFDISLYAPEDLDLNEIYLTISENLYDGVTPTGSAQISCYLEKCYDENNDPIYGTKTDDSGLVLYQLRVNYSMAAMPAGYFTFYVDLPNGYGAICYTSKENKLDKTTAPGSSNTKSFLPHTTIIPITVGLRILVSELTGADTSVWAVNTSDLYTRQVDYKGEEPTNNANNG